MEPNEILPEPEVTGYDNILESTDTSSEEASVKNTEQKQGSSQGSTAISGLAIDDAQGAVAQYQGQAVSDLGATVSSASTVVIPESAEDIDLIEKVWVQKAKQIVESTLGDPYIQNKQLNKMKVEYIKKRYDKDIKYSEEK